MPSTPASGAAPAARESSALLARLRPSRGGRIRPLAAAAFLLAGCALTIPAEAAEPFRRAAEPARPDPRGGGALLLLSFLIPLPMPMALVAPPSATRDPGPPSDPCSGPRRTRDCVAVRRDASR